MHCSVEDLPKVFNCSVASLITREFQRNVGFIGFLSGHLNRVGHPDIQLGKVDSETGRIITSYWSSLGSERISKYGNWT